MTTTLTSGLTPARSVLDNGAVVLVQETSTTPAVAINVTFSAGGVQESSALPGLAYFTGRLLDRGSERRSGDLLAEELDDRGVTLRITSTRHTTAATCTCLAEDFDDVLSIVLDAVSRPVFPETEIVKRRAELISVIRRDEDNPSVRAVETFFELLYGAAHPYGWRSKGTLESVERIARQDLAAFHDTWFRPAALSVALVGDVCGSEAVERVAAELDGWSGRPPADQPVPPAPAPGPRRLHRASMPGKSQTEIAYGFTAVRRKDPRYFAYWLMNNVLGQFGLGGRLADNIRERQGMAYYAFSLFDPSVGDGPLLVRAGVAPSDVERALAAIDFEVGRMAGEGPTPKELQDTRQYLIGSVPRFLETNAGIAVFLQTAEQFDLGLDYDQQLPRQLHAVTLDEVAAAASEVLHPEHAVVSIAGPPQTAREDAS